MSSKIFTLFGSMEYEGSYLLGVYTSPSKAYQALKKYRAVSSSANFDQFYLEERVLDEPAEPSFISEATEFID